MKIEIKYLSDLPETIPTLAKIWYDGIGQHFCPSITHEEICARYELHCNKETLPLALVAFDSDAGRPCGMVSLRVHDAVSKKIREDLSPWLSALVVDSSYQNQGIAKILIGALEQKALQMGFQTVYLFTNVPRLPAYYGSLGWCEIERKDYEGRGDYIVMKKELTLALRMKCY